MREQAPADRRSLFEEEFAAYVAGPEFPCLGAKAAFNAGSYVFSEYAELAAESSSLLLAQNLEKFVASDLRRENEYATFVAVFHGPASPNEREFEQLFWSQLQQLHRIDARRHAWDSSVASDPADARFSFSFAGQALYVVGMHPNSSRLARRFSRPAMILNPHDQFERLRHDGKWQRMQQVIRERDIALQGNVNPMLCDFGEASEARQYSGRAVEANWRAPFQTEQAEAQAPSRCPFGH